MFRSTIFAAVLAAPFATIASANAQSLAVVDVRVTAAPASSAPLSITQKYVPVAPSAPRALGLLVGDPGDVAPAPVASISVTSSAPENVARMAVNDLSAGRSTIVVSNANARGVRE